MGKVRVFYGHEGVVPPTGLRPRSAAPAQPEEAGVEVDEIVADDPNGEPVEIIGEAVEESEVTSPAVIVNADGSEVEVDESGIPVLQPIEIVGEEIEGAQPEEAPVIGDPEFDDEIPNGEWTVGQIEEWAKAHDVDLTGATKNKKTRLARISDHLTKEG